MKTKGTLIHVEFTSGPRSGEHHYFGSITAIYSTFSTVDLGVARRTLYGYDIDPNKPYTNRLCIIRKGEVSRKDGNRTAPVKILRVQ